MKKLRFPFSAPLNEQDTAEQTLGCRANNPDICGNNELHGLCAFVRDDGICTHPSKAWKRQYAKLKERENEIK